MPCLVHHFIQGVQLEDVVDQVVIAIRQETVQGHEVARVESRVVCRVVSETKILLKKCRSDHNIPIDPPFDISSLRAERYQKEKHKYGNQ